MPHHDDPSSAERAEPAQAPVRFRVERYLLAEVETLGRVVLHVRADQDLHTGELHDVQVLDLRPYRPTVDSAAFAAMVARGRVAWADVPDAGEWVEAQRG